MSERFNKRGVDRVIGPNEKYEDGTTEAQRVNMRVIYEDPEVYAEWRIQKGLDKAPEIHPTNIMRQRVADLAKRLSFDLRASLARHPRDPWLPPQARKLSLEELGDIYSREAPSALSPELHSQFKATI